MIVHDTATAIVTATMLDPARRGHGEFVRVFVIAAKVAGDGIQAEWHEWDYLQRLGWSVVDEGKFLKLLVDLTPEAE